MSARKFELRMLPDRKAALSDDPGELGITQRESMHTTLEEAKSNGERLVDDAAWRGFEIVKLGDDKSESEKVFEYIKD